MLHDYQSKKSCKEVTQLYRAANKFIKTLYLARIAMISGDDNTAILNYNEVASILLERKDAEGEDGKKGRGDRGRREYNQNLAICYNNIACIHAKQKDYAKQASYFNRSIQIAIDLIKNSNLQFSMQKLDQKTPESLEEIRFKLACRLYNYGFALFK